MNILKIFVLLTTVIAILALAPPCRADTDEGLFTIPSHSLVKYSSYHAESETWSFNGRFLLSGTFHYTTDPETLFDGQDYNFYFVPDKSIARRLPHRSQDEAIIDSLYFDNDMDFLKAALPPAIFARLKTAKNVTISGRASVWADHFNATTNCDHADYTVHFDALDKTHPVRIFEMKINDADC